MKNYGCGTYAAIAIVLIGIGCNPNKKLAKLEEKYPKMFQLHNTDSIKTVIKVSEHDSLIQGATVFKHDTSIQFKENVKTVYVRTTETIHDTVIRTIHDSIKTTEIKNTSGIAKISVPAPLTWWQTTQMRSGDLLLIFILIALIYGAFRLYLRFKP